jgi:hypothetical protein
MTTFIPTPDEYGIPFGLYNALLSTRRKNDHDGGLPKNLERQMEMALTNRELEQVDFAGESEALTALIRALGLMNTLRKLVQPNPDISNP